jgi:hypothetical protein
MQKGISFKTKGMQRDLAASAFNSEFAYENKNIRIITNEDNTLYSLVNEKGTKLVNINGIDSIKGVVIGEATIDDELILFTTVFIPLINDKRDRIYKIKLNGDNLDGQVLFEGNLNFNPTYPIETLVFYENEYIKKVYWTDGLNQPRVINIAATPDVISKWNNDSFNFVRTLNLNEKVTIERNIVASGSFAPGVIQYAFTYFNKYGQESNIFYTSPLYYISYNNRGASPEDRVSNSFNIEMTNVDSRFDYIRIYSIHRTSINATPDVKRVVDLAPPLTRSYYELSEYEINLPANKMTMYRRDNGAGKTLDQYKPSYSGANYKSWEFSTDEYDSIDFGDGDYLTWDGGTIFIITITDGNKASMQLANNGIMAGEVSIIAKVTYTDSGTSGDSIDPTELLYIGGEEVVFGTMAQKDNTLFLGDIQMKRKILDSTIKNYFKGKKIIFSTYNKSIDSPEPKGYYSYSNQLKMNSYQFKTFKYLEYYRFGIQAQHYTGKWSEPIWINDVRNNVPIDTTFYSSNNIGLPVAEFTLIDSTIINRFLDNGYVRIRPVVVYPTINDREVICQGILCPTVYNVSDRYGNSPFAQSSWFTRPNAPFDVHKAFHYSQDSSGKWTSDWKEFGGNKSSIYSRAGVMTNNRTNVHNGSTITLIADIVNKGAWAEFRHNYPIPSNDKRNAEIQCIWNPPSNPYVNNSMDDTDVSSWVSQYAENYYIDQSIVTLHSPDIEFDNEVRSIDTSELKLRIVGIVPITAFVADIDIQTSTPVNNFKGSSELPLGFYKEPVGAENEFYSTKSKGDSHFGWRGLISGAFWFDELAAYKGQDNPNHLTTGFAVYPWHRSGSLNNTKFATDGYRSAMLDKKKISNMRFSYKTQYISLRKVWNAYIKDNYIRTGISGVAIFDSNEVSLVRLPAQENSGLSDINYYGNVDKLLTVSRIGDKKDGYPIMTSGVQNADTDAHKLFSGNFVQIDSRFTDQITGIDPVRIKYKSTPHAVLALNYTTSGAQRILPTIQDYDRGYPITTDIWNVNYAGGNITSGQHPFWDKNKNISAISQDIIDSITGDAPMIGGIQYGWLWLGELYNDNVQNRFGGQTEEAFENNVWLPCGDPISLVGTNNKVKESVIIKWEEGDTYFQRYDHIKTYPFTLEDQNAVTDIVSFMCETRVNLDGRYDRNRGQTSNFAITPENFNLMNDVYSQQNNFFNYRTINPNKLNLDNFHNSITWTKTKTVGELVDTWTNITLASTLDLDGDKGKIRALKRLNNSIIAMQDTGISQILYNENTQISTTEGVPVEIANSGKVQGKRYISDKIGCTNKWSICETPNGIYFVDDITKGIYLFNGQLNNISDKLGFHSWIKATSKDINIWNPINFNSFVTYYDKTNSEVLFISKDSCLGYSELLNQFTSFYNYENTPYFSNLLDKGIWIKDNKLWLHNEGDYNMFFGVYQPFYTTVIANPDMPVDKIFNNLEFRSDSWDENGNLLNTTFDTLTVWNEYQQGTSTLNNILGRPSDLKKKFRIWRANIPRDKVNGRDRMRNPWLYIKLSMEEENVNKTVLHDMIVHYFE